MYEQGCIGSNQGAETRYPNIDKSATKSKKKKPNGLRWINTRTS